MTENIMLGSRSYSVNLRRSGSSFSLQIDDKKYEGTFSRTKNSGLEITVEGRRSFCYAEKKSDETYVFADGVNYVLCRQSLRAGPAVPEEQEEDLVLSPITGKMLERKFENGSGVKEGDVVIVLEAMKMEHRLKSPRDGTISRITSVDVGGQVKEGEIMFELEEE